MEIAKLVLDYIKVITSPQMVIAAVITIFVTMFHQEIRNLIGRILSIKFADGSVVNMSQSERTSSELPAKNDPPTVPDAPKTDLPENLSLAPDQVKTIQELIQAERATSYLWEYRYLNYYLARGTQYVLDWLAVLPQRPHTRLVDSVWTPAIPSMEERQAILAALQQHHLITMKDDLIEVTPKGREYIEWRGAMPPLPPQARQH